MQHVLVMAVANQKTKAVMPVPLLRIGMAGRSTRFTISDVRNSVRVSYLATQPLISGLSFEISYAPAEYPLRNTTLVQMQVMKQF